MAKLIDPAPPTPIEVVTDVWHGVPVADPYRWLENQNSSQTRKWLTDQTQYARTYLDGIPGRHYIRERVREFLAVDSHDSLQRAGNHYYFRKQLPEQEQPCICMHAGFDGEDNVLVNPAERGTGKYTAVLPRCLSPDGRLLLYEVKQGGERTGTFELLDVRTRTRLPDSLPRGHLHGFAFAPDSKTFYYAHEATDTPHQFYRAAYEHVLGDPIGGDREIFFAGEDEKLRLHIISGEKRLGFLVRRFLDKTYTDFFLASFEDLHDQELLVANVDFLFAPRILADRILAITDREGPNLGIVEVHRSGEGHCDFVSIVPNGPDRIHHWAVAGNQVFVAYIRGTKIEADVFDLSGHKIGRLPLNDGETVRLMGASPDHDEILLETQSFVKPIALHRYSTSSGRRITWTERRSPFDSSEITQAQVWFTSRDGTRVPMSLLGPKPAQGQCPRPMIMTSYGGFGVSMTPRFSVLVAFLLQHGCLFALPSIRGGSEFGAAWHQAGKRRNRQTAFDDFLCAAEWLINTGHTTPEKLAVFGGSNSGLLVGAALTQRPDLFCAVLSIAPLFDMLRYHLFDNAGLWRDEYGTAADADDFAVLRSYSPYHRVSPNVSYPAVMIVSGDADRKCNPLHARKMTARLQAASVSGHPIFLDYSQCRGHSPVLPLSDRIQGLTDRLAFLCDQLQLPV